MDIRMMIWLLFPIILELVVAAATTTETLIDPTECLGPMSLQAQAACVFAEATANVNKKWFSTNNGYSGSSISIISNNNNSLSRKPSTSRSGKLVSSLSSYFTKFKNGGSGAPAAGRGPSVITYLSYSALLSLAMAVRARGSAYDVIRSQSPHRLMQLRKLQACHPRYAACNHRVDCCEVSLCALTADI